MQPIALSGPESRRAGPENLQERQELGQRQTCRLEGEEPIWWGEVAQCRRGTAWPLEQSGSLLSRLG